jgi:hypothetical protein
LSSQLDRIEKCVKCKYERYCAKTDEKEKRDLNLNCEEGYV